MIFFYEIAIGLGVFLSLLFSELLGVTAGGIIVPGYIALYFHDLLSIIGTFATSLLVFFAMKAISQVMFLFGRRRLTLALLLGFLFGYFSRHYFVFEAWETELTFDAIGWIIPGLIANWMFRQGVIRTISMVLLTSVLIKLILILISGGKIGAYV